MCGVANSWIESNRPSKNIYAVWQENEYTIEYDTGVSATVKYSDTVTFAKPAYVYRLDLRRRVS